MILEYIGLKSHKSVECAIKKIGLLRSKWIYVLCYHDCTGQFIFLFFFILHFY